MPKSVNPFSGPQNPTLPSRVRKLALEKENEELRARLAEAEETLNAIQSGEVDALVVSGSQGEQVFTLRHAEYGYRALVEAMNDGAAIISASGLVTYCNQRFTSLLGLPEEKAIGQPVQSLLPPAHLPAFDALFRRAVRGEACAAEFRFETVDGKPGVVYVSLSSVQANDAPSVCMVVTDLTQHQSEVRLRLAQNAARCGTWQWDPISGDATWSEELWAIFGLAPYSSRPGVETWLRAVHPDDREQAARTFAQQVAEGHLDFEYRLLWPDGSVHWTVSLGTLSAPNSIVGLNMDITARKQTELALLRSEKLASVGRMAASIAHEINNPLAAVMNTLYLAQDCDGLPDPARQYLSIAEGELKRIAHITRQSLGFYRESSEPTVFPVDTLLDSVLDLLYAKIKAKRVTIEKQCDSSLQMQGVFGELRQVFSNLLINSLDAVDTHGAIKLRGSLAPRSSHRQLAIRITIADNGAGAVPAVLSRVFEPFFTTKGAIGTGLGLWITKQILDKHNGSIRVRSRTHDPQKGTTFSIILPAATASSN